MVGAQPAALGGFWIAPVYTTAIGASVLPQIQTVDSFSITPEGVEMTVKAAFTNTSSQYFRIGLVATDNALHNYWFTLHRSEVQLHKRNGVATPIKLADYTFNTGDWTLNEPRDFSLRVVPVDGNYQLNIMLDGVSVISFLDTSALPDFTNGFNLFVATRENQQGYIGTMTLQTIPEGQTLAFLAGGALLLCPLLRRRKASR